MSAQEGERLTVKLPYQEPAVDARELAKKALRLIDPNYEKSGYAPRKAELAEWVVALVAELGAQCERAERLEEDLKNTSLSYSAALETIDLKQAKMERLEEALRAIKLSAPFLARVVDDALNPPTKARENG